MIEPPVYLDPVLREVRLADGSIVVRRFETAADLAALPEPTIINTTRGRWNGSAAGQEGWGRTPIFESIAAEAVVDGQ